ncbi:MAG: aminotransferase class IV [Bacteroidales bacterium]|nr:aminotransferase class IV [Bacteroidales bacterium]
MKPISKTGNVKMELCLNRYFVEDGELKNCYSFVPERMQWPLAVYDVIRIANSKPLFLTDHLKRLLHSGKLIGLSQSPDMQAISYTFKQLITANKVDEGNIRIQLGIPKGQHNLSFALWFIPHYYPTEDEYKKGVAAILVNYQRMQPNAKVYYEQYKTTQEKLRREHKVFETLLNSDEGITEGSRSNVFFIGKKEIITAPDHLVLKGITRQKTLQLCQQQGFPIKYRCVTTDELIQIQGAFITGTSPQILSLNQIDQFRHFNPRHPWILRLRKAFTKLIQSDWQNFDWDQMKSLSFESNP